MFGHATGGAAPPFASPIVFGTELRLSNHVPGARSTFEIASQAEKGCVMRLVWALEAPRSPTEKEAAHLETDVFDGVCLSQSHRIHRLLCFRIGRNRFSHQAYAAPPTPHPSE